VATTVVEEAEAEKGVFANAVFAKAVIAKAVVAKAVASGGSLPFAPLSRQSLRGSPPRWRWITVPRAPEEVNRG
jgi:hypothetical protein